MRLIHASWATTDDWLAHKDDSGYDCIELLAMPTGIVFWDLEAAKRECLRSLKEDYEETGDNISLGFRPGMEKGDIIDVIDEVGIKRGVMVWHAVDLHEG